MKKVFEIAAIILAVAACNKAELDNTPANYDGNGIPFRAKISTTKALSEGVSGITATWAVDEEVALVYNDGTARKDVVTVESVSAGVAIISGTITGTPADNSDVTIIYPATAADGTTGNILSNLLENNQVGTLADIEAKYDVRKGTGKFQVSGTASLKGAVALTNQFSIFKFTVRTSDGTSPINVKPLVITINAVDYTVTPASATDELYVALPAIDAKAVSFTATDGGSVKYYCSKPSVTFSAGAYYQSTLKMSSQLGLTGQFSVSSTKKVTFSQGNLQWFYGENIHKTAAAAVNSVNSGSNYNGGVFTFADNQWDICGSNNAGYNRSKGQIASHINDYTNSKRIDLFSYASSGYRSASNYVYQPFFANNDEYWSYTLGLAEADIAGTNSDWGVFNAILNGGDTPDMWRTLTQPEWAYLINERTDATSKRGFATVAGVRGVILLPDSWTKPGSAPDFVAVSNLVTTDNSSAPTYAYASAHWGDNTYDAAGWADMEAAGAVFLPAAGTLDPANNSVKYYNVGDGNAGVSYWTSSWRTSDRYAHAFDLGTADGKYINWRFDQSSRPFGRAVRLVRDVE